MTDWAPLRAVSNFIWGSDPEYKDQSQSRHFAHGSYHSAINFVNPNPGDARQAEKHWSSYHANNKAYEERQIQAWKANPNAKINGYM